MASVASREHTLYNNPSEIEAAARNVAFHWRTPDGFYYPNGAWMRTFAGNGSFVRFLGPERIAAKGRIGSKAPVRSATCNGRNPSEAVGRSASVNDKSWPDYGR